MHPSYARGQPTSRPELYEFSLVKAVKGKTKKDAGKVKHKGKKAKNAAKH